MTALPVSELLDDTSAPSTKEIAAKIAKATQFASQLDEKESDLSPEIKTYVKEVMDQLSITGRGYGKLMRVARTIAHLEHSPEIEKHHLQEALAYRKIRLLL